VTPILPGNRNTTEKRVPGIDVLRGFCIVAVVLHHINLRIHFNQSAAGRLIGPAANRVLFWSGYYGVRVFFVISGFLIATWSIRRWGGLGKLNSRDFYKMRFARIMPSLIGLLLILSVLDLARAPQFIINPQRASLPRALLAALTFHVNWLEAKTGYLPSGWDVLWSLSVEEVFYLMFPVLCTWLKNRFLFTGVLLTFAVIGPFARVFTRNPLWSDYGYMACMDGIAIGCLAALFATRIKLGYKTNVSFRTAGIILCLLIEIFRGTAAKIGFYKAGLDVTILQIGTALLLIALQQSFDHSAKRSNSHRRFRPERYLAAVLRWFGRNSYEVYLTHMLVVWPAVMLFFHLHGRINWATFWFLGITAVAGGAGYLIARFYSEPLNRFLRARTHRRPQLAAMEAAGD